MRGSIFLGAKYPRHTTKISAEAAREAAGLVEVTDWKNWFRTHKSLLYSADLNTFVTNVPLGRKNSVASLSAMSTSSAWPNASLFHWLPTLGAPSCKTLQGVNTTAVGTQITLISLHISRPFFDDLFNLSSAFRSCDVFLKRKHVWNGLDGIQINTDNNSLGRHIFSGDLKPI